MQNIKHLRKIIISSLILILTIGLELFNVVNYASELNRYTIDVIDDGNTQTKRNDDVSISQRIVKATDKELTYEVNFENYQYQTTQIALVVDNSFSMWSDDKLIKSKNSISKLVDLLFTEVDGLKMSLSTYDGIEIHMGTDKDAIMSVINNITEYKGVTTKTGYIYGNETFTSEESNKFIVAFTDGEENILDTLTAIKENGVGLITAYYGNSITAATRAYRKTGTIYGMNKISESILDTVNSRIRRKIRASLEREINNVNISNTFSDEIKNNFTFEIILDPTVGFIDDKFSTEGKFEWNINSLSKKSAVRFRYKLTLKNNIDRNIMYKDILTNNSMNVTYDFTNDTTTTDTDIVEREATSGELVNNNSAKIKIKETYTIEIQAINKKYTNLGAKGITFTIKKVDTNGNIENLGDFVTDKDGKIVLDKLTDIGTYKFEIEQKDAPAGYEDLEDSEKVKNIVVTKDLKSNTLSYGSTNIDNSLINLNQNEKIINAKILMDPREFLIKINKIDKEYLNKLKDATFELKEPKCDNIPNDTSVNGTIYNENDGLILTAEVAGEGTYTYKLLESKNPVGYYENNDEMNVNVTFGENGELKRVSYLSENITNNKDTAISGDTINLDVANRMLDYKLKVQAFNNEYNNIKVDDVEVQITGKDTSGNIVYDKVGVTKNGKIELDINKYGKIEYTIHQIKAPAGYNITEDAKFDITRIFETNELILNGVYTNIELDNNKKVLTANIYLEQQKFKFKVNKIDAETGKLLNDAELKIN